MNTDELKIPPAGFVAQVAAGDDTENAMEEWTLAKKLMSDTFHVHADKLPIKYLI